MRSENPPLWTPLRLHRALHAALVLPSHPPSLSSGKKKPEIPAQTRRLLHRRSSWVLLAAAPREISPPPPVSSPKIRAFPLPAFVSPVVLICCFLGSPWMEMVMPVSAPAAPRSVLVSGVVAGFAPGPTARRCSSGSVFRPAVSLCSWVVWGWQWRGIWGFVCCGRR